MAADHGSPGMSNYINSFSAQACCPPPADEEGFAKAAHKHVLKNQTRPIAWSQGKNARV